MQDVRIGAAQIKALKMKVNALTIEKECIIKIKMQEHCMLQRFLKIKKGSKKIRTMMGALSLCLPT